MLFSSLLSLLATLPALACAITSRTEPPAGAIIVRQTGAASGEFSTISAAVASLLPGTPQTIFVFPGTYAEQVFLNRTGKLKIMGFTEDVMDFSKNQISITAGVTAAVAGNNDRSGTLRVNQEDFSLYNINVINSFGPGTQAIALSAQRSRQGYYACTFEGFQDTVLTNSGSHYFGHSLIKGSVDYIFGQRSQAVFKSCVLRSMNTGWVTANGRSTNDAGGYLFDNCNLEIDAAAPQPASRDASGYYLGRPWRTFSRVKFQNSVIGEHISSAGWRNWNTDNSDNTTNVEYSEFCNTGPGADVSKRVAFSRQDAAATPIEDIIGADFRTWVDAAYL